MSNVLEHDKLLFICANPGAGGYKLGRIISCFNNVFWYSNGRNGYTPWDIYQNDRVAGKNISGKHYDRYIGYQMVPLAGERIECYWEQDDIDTFYNTVWATEMLKSGAISIMDNDMYISWIVHDTPQYIRSRFPNAKIVNLFDTDIDQIAKRYLTTTSHFPVYFNKDTLKPTYLNDYARTLDELMTLNPKPRIKDLWMWKTHQAPIFDKECRSEYLEDITKMLEVYNNDKKIESPSYLSLTLDSLSVDTLQKYLNSTAVNENVTLLIK